MRSGPFVSGQNILAQQLSAVRADAYGAGSLLVHQQLGFFTLSTNPTNTKTLTLTINGTAVTLTFVSSIGSTPGNVLIGATAAATCANLLALLNQPQTTTATGVALSAINQTLVSYLSYALSGTTLTVSSNNTTLYAPLLSFTGATNATSDSFTAQTMQLYVEPGVFYIAGTRVIFAGGSTSTVTAPASNPRIDVLSINSSGTLSWTTGTENASPVAPTYPNPTSNLVLCELYNVVAETALYDNANQTGGQGYIYNDVRTFQQPAMNWGAFASSLVPDADGTRNLGSPSFEWNNLYVKTGIFVNGLAPAIAKFGGTGADGSLSISSGTTTLALGSARAFQKNYTSISITGTAVLTFSGAHTMGTYIKLRSQGNLTVTSSATAAVVGDGLGASGGNGVGMAWQYNAGTISSGNSAGGGGGGGSLAGKGSSGFGIASGIGGLPITGLSPWGASIEPGGGGSSGQTGDANGFSSGAGGAGGAGGAAIDFEIAGNINITSTFSSKGAAGANSSNNVSGGNSGGGGGGGGGGAIRIVYSGSVTANSASFTVTGGSGGTAGTGGTVGSTGGAGANGDSLVAVNTFFP